jgi:hypothetical protein
MQRGQYRFSVRDLLVLMSLVSLGLSVAVLSRGSPYVGALASPWTWVSLVPVELLWLCRRRPGAQQWFVRGSMLAYGASLCLPAIAMYAAPNTDLLFGFQAWLQSYAFGIGYLENVILLKSPRVLWPVDEWEALACAAGCIANSLLIIGWLALWLARRKQRPPVAARRLARTAFALMFASLIPIATAGQLSAIYPGFGLWAASALMLSVKD